MCGRRSVLSEDEVEARVIEAGVTEIRGLVKKAKWWHPWLIGGLGLVLVIVAGVVVAVVGFSGSSTAIELSVDLNDPGSTAGLTNGAACAGKGSYSDLNSSAVVEVRNADGNLIDVEPLGPGVVWGQTHCLFRLSLSVPSSAIYGFEVASRDSVTLSKGELMKQHWKASLDFGPAPQPASPHAAGE